MAQPSLAPCAQSRELVRLHNLRGSTYFAQFLTSLALHIFSFATMYWDFTKTFSIQFINSPTSNRPFLHLNKISSFLYFKSTTFSYTKPTNKKQKKNSLNSLNIFRFWQITLYKISIIFVKILSYLGAGVKKCFVRSVIIRIWMDCGWGWFWKIARYNFSTSVTMVWA